jgi:hypothetical protein
MNNRAELDEELDHLEGMLPVWLEKLRHQSQFWPQFDALADEIVGHSDQAELAHVRERLEKMLQANHLQLDRWPRP